MIYGRVSVGEGREGGHHLSLKRLETLGVLVFGVVGTIHEGADTESVKNYVLRQV